MNVEMASLVVAGVSAIASALAVWVAVRANRLSREANDNAARANQRLIAIEEGRDRAAAMAAKTAFVRADLVRQHRCWLRVWNEGSGRARQIRILLDGEPLSEHRHFAKGQDEVNELAARASVKYKFDGIPLSNELNHVHIEWLNESGESGHWESPL